MFTVSIASCIAIVTLKRIFFPHPTPLTPPPQKTWSWRENKSWCLDQKFLSHCLVFSKFQKVSPWCGMFFILLNQFYVLFTIKSNNFKRNWFLLLENQLLLTLRERGVWKSKIETHVRIKFLWGILQLLQELKSLVSFPYLSVELIGEKKVYFT